MATFKQAEGYAASTRGRLWMYGPGEPNQLYVQEDETDPIPGGAVPLYIERAVTDQRTDAEKAADAEDVFKRWLAVVPAGMEWGYAVDTLTEWVAADPDRLAAFRRDHPKD